MKNQEPNLTDLIREYFHNEKRFIKCIKSKTQPSQIFNVWNNISTSSNNIERMLIILIDIKKNIETILAQTKLIQL